MDTLERGQVVRPYREFEPWQVLRAGPDPKNSGVGVVRVRKLPSGEARTGRMPATNWIHGDLPLPF